MRKVPGSNRAVGSCVYRKNHCDLQPWAARAVRTLPAVTRSTQPSTLRGTVNEYQLLSWLSNNNNPKFFGFRGSCMVSKVFGFRGKKGKGEEGKRGVKGGGKEVKEGTERKRRRRMG